MSERVEELPEFITRHHQADTGATPTTPPTPTPNAEKCRRYREKQAAKKADQRTRGDRTDIMPLGVEDGVQYEAFRYKDQPKDTQKIVAPVPLADETDQQMTGQATEIKSIDISLKSTSPETSLIAEHKIVDETGGNIASNVYGPEKNTPDPVQSCDLAEPARTAAMDISRPPKRLPIRTKGVWQTLSESLREDIILREQEFDRAFARYDGLGQYAIQAEKSGTTLAAAVKDYSTVEAEFRKDPIGGAIYAWRRLGWDPNAVVAEVVRRVQAAIQPPPEASRTPAPPVQDPLEAAKAQGRLEHEIEVARANPYNLYLDDFLADGTISAMRAANPTLDVQSAYNAAITAKGLAPMPMNRVRDPHPRSMTPAERARNAAKATIGSPSSAVPHDPNARKDDGRSLEQVVSDALDRQAGRH